MVSWSRNSSHSRRHCQPYFFRTDTVFLYGGDAQAGRPASLTYGAVARIAAQELEYEGDAAGEAVDRIFRRCRRTVGSNRCGSTGTRSRSRLCLRFRGDGLWHAGRKPTITMVLRSGAKAMNMRIPAHAATGRSAGRLCKRQPCSRSKGMNTSGRRSFAIRMLIGLSFGRFPVPNCEKSRSTKKHGSPP